MSGNYKKEDLRVSKTYKALSSSLLTLISKRSFDKITVNDLCEEALVSRATFYSHFNDKYKLLEYTLVIWRDELLTGKENYSDQDMIKFINKFVYDNKVTIKNILDFGSAEIFKISLEIINPVISPKDNDKYSATINGNFCLGGIISALYVQIKSKFPPDKPLLDEELYNLIKMIIAK